MLYGQILPMRQQMRTKRERRKPMAESIAQVIKYEGDNQTFIWKHPIEDFNSGTQLIVHESQEAVFFMNGQALDSFGPGRYSLETQNMPMVAKFFNRVTDDQNPFHCEVYFINKTEQMAIKWGTDSKMEYVEPTYGFPIQIGACGEMNLRVEDGRKLLITVVGTERGITQAGRQAGINGAVKAEHFGEASRYGHKKSPRLNAGNIPRIRKNTTSGKNYRFFQENAEISSGS